MRIGNTTIWLTAKQARAMGATHHARIHGLIPGFVKTDDFCWFSRSDLLNPIEDVLSAIYETLCAMKGIDLSHTFDIGQPIDADAQTEEVDNNAG